MKKEIIELLNLEFKKNTNNISQQKFIQNLLKKLISDDISASESYDLVDIVSYYLIFDTNGNPIENTLEIEEMIDWILEKYNDNHL